MTHCFLLASISLLIGCRNGLDPDYGKLGLVNISGQVQLDGKPQAGVQVIFEESPQVYSYGNTDTSGNYTLMFDSRKAGVVPGPKTVRFKSNTSVGESKKTEGDDPDAKPDRKSNSIPDCYGKNSKLKVEVKTSESNFNFNLKSDCSTQGRE